MPASAQQYVFAQLKGAPVNTSGWNFTGSAKVVNVTSNDNSEVLLTPAAAGTSGAVFFSQPINLSMCKKWKAEFDYRLYDGTSADGFAFCFLDVPPTGFVSGSGMGIPKTANGLKICFDTYNNCSGDTKYQMPKLEVRWGAGYGIYNAGGTLVTEGECRNDNGPTVANVNGQLNFMRSNSYVHVIVEYNGGNLSVQVGNLQLVTNETTPGFNFTGYLGFTASTGGSTDNQSIKNVIIYTEMPPSVAGQSANPVCPYTQVQLGGANTAGYSYSWSPAGGLSSSTVSNPVATVDNTTGSVLYQKYFVKTAFANNPGCSSTDSVTITVNPKPLVDFDMPIVCLPNGNVTVNNRTTINDGTQAQLKYNWSFSDGGTSTAANPTHVYNTAGDYSITLAATSPAGCKNENTKSFTIYTQAKAVITAPAEFCQDSALLFSGSAGNAGVAKWRWDFGDNGIDTVQNPKHTYAAAKTYTVKMHAVTVQGCASDTAVITIPINPLPVAAFTYSGNLCNGQTVTFKDASSASTGAIKQQNWGFDDGTTGTGTTTTKSFTPYGTHSVSLKVQNAKGCFSKLYTQNLVIGPAPVAGFTTPVICKGAAGVFTDASTIADGTQNQFTYAWYFGDGGTSSSASPSHIYTNAGNYTAKLVVTSANGCADSIPKNVQVSDLPVVDFSILTTDFCGNLPLQIKDNSTVQYATLDSLKIFWDASQPSYTAIGNPAAGTVYTHNYPPFGYVNQLPVTLKVQALSSGGCYTEKTGVSVLFASPKLVFGQIPSFCETVKQSIVLNQARDTSIFQGTGFYSGDGVTNGSFNPALAGPGNHTITYTYTLSNGCSDSVTTTARVGAKPVVYAGPTGVVLQGGQITLQGSASGGDNLQFRWSPAETLSEADILQPVATPVKDTYYTLNATNSDGCSDSSGVLIKVLLYPLVPNAFSPNGDGINDKWQISYISSYPDCKIEVFNRYGQLVFTSTGYALPWDGTTNNKPLPIGTYYYIISSSHIPKPLSGSVTIVR